MMVIILKYIAIFHLLATAIGSFHLYYTTVSNNSGYKDCLYSFKTDTGTNEGQLVPYCIRHDFSTINDGSQSCYGDDRYTFEQLKMKYTNSDHLYSWNAPIDTINAYQKYLLSNDVSLANSHYCNCSDHWFGTQCQYSLDRSYRAETFDEIIIDQFRRKQSLKDNYNIIKDPSLLTCYEGLRCHSTICLDWRQICDGEINCQNGQDEPDECFLLELNECQNDEYRCRSGMCIPKTFLIDFAYQCMDLSDETATYSYGSADFSCYSSPMLVCDFRLCSVDTFSCGDGQCMPIQRPKTTCNNGRDLFFRRSLLDFKTSDNLTIECWHLMLCIAGERIINLFDYNYSQCRCFLYYEYHINDDQCLAYFQKHCPASFSFQSEMNKIYPFGQSLYHHTSNSSDDWWWPSHFCYNQSYCVISHFSGLPLIDGLICVKVRDLKEWPPSQVKFLQILSGCTVSRRSWLVNDKRLFYCNETMKFISKHRVRDTIRDCLNSQDEYTGLSVMYTLNLTDRFKCIKTDQWWPRPLVGDGRCVDKSDTFLIGTCKKASDTGCQFLRGLYTPPVHYVFRENCNHVPKLSSYYFTHETDETDCDEWPIYRCDDYWDVYNGEDELNCRNTISSYITYTVLKCNINEHYCAYQNGTMGCLSKEYVGDGIIDCLGATDERNMSCVFSSPLKPFYCSNKLCLPLSSLCDNIWECPPGSLDEVICPWLDNYKCQRSDFICKNGTCLARTKQCDGIIDCQPDAEDEWFCDLEYRKTAQFSLAKIDEYPLMTDDSSHTINVTIFHSDTPSRIHIFPYKTLNPLHDWFCNRGIIVRTRSSDTACLCPPSYYGVRCEYQAERVLIIVQIDILASLRGRQNQYSAVRLLARLMLNDTVFHQEQFLHIPLMKQMFYLNYPRPPPKQAGNWSVRFDAFVVTTWNVDFKSSWLFDVPFSFLPVNQLVLHLTLKDQDICHTRTCIHGQCRKYLNSPYREYCQCEKGWSGSHCNISIICSCAGGGQCIDRPFKAICVCHLGRMGDECEALFDPCQYISCENGGICLPLDERQSPNFICACPSDYYGDRCEFAHAVVNIRFSKSLSDYNNLRSTAIITHFLEIKKDLRGVLVLQNRFLYTQVSLNQPLIVFNHKQKYLSTFLLLQIFFKPDIIDYYIATIIKNHRMKITTTIYPSNRCPYVNEVLENRTIREFSSMKKVKYYRYVCEMNNNIKCFHDEAYLCFCYKDQLPDCLFFQRESTQCMTDYCQNDGRCVQNNFNGIWDFGCVCSGCAYGSLCQLTTSQYVLSLDALLGQDIIQSISVIYQPILIKIVLAVIVLMFTFGLVSNTLSLIIFKQPKVREFGCGLYLFCLPIVGQLGLSILAGRFFYLLHTQLYNVTNRLAVKWSCIGLEYLLTVCPMLFDWLTACVAVERSVNMAKGASFRKADSVWWAKRIIIGLTIIVLASGWHEFFIHQLIDDPRVIADHTWCVIVWQWPSLEYYRLVVNLINLIIPCSINLIAMIFLLHKSTRMKQALANTQAEKNYFASFKKQLPKYGSPFGLIVLSLMRLIFSFTLVCITRQWQKYVYLTAYFISFAPLMGTFPIFVLPAKNYKTEFKSFTERTRRKFIF